MARRRQACVRAPKRCRRCCRRLPKADFGETNDLTERSTMRRTQRLIAACVLIVFSGVLGGCSSGGFDPSDLLDFLDTKKKLPGDRKPVFPDGVPGLEQGVPKELYKGAQQQPDPQGAPPQAAAAAPPPEPPPSKQAAKSKKGRAAASV